MIIRKKVIPVLLALVMTIAFMPLSSLEANAESDYKRVTLNAYDVNTGQTFTDGITWYFNQQGSLVKKNTYTFLPGTDITIRAFLDDDSPYVAVEWREGDPLTGNTFGTVSDWTELRTGLVDATYYLIVEPKCPQDGGRHEWSPLMKKATLIRDGGIYKKCSKCESEELITPIAAIGSVELDAASYTYDGEAKTPGVTVLDMNDEAVDPNYYTIGYEDNVNAGTAKATVTFNTHYEGVKELAFEIEPKWITPLVKVNDQVYTGKAIKPSLTVRNGAVRFKNGADYAVNYTNNTKVGKATARVVMKGNYSGNKSASFKILPKKAGVSKAVPGKNLVKVTMFTKVAATGGTTYQINYRLKGVSKWKSVTTTGKINTIKKLKKGKKYQIRVRAYKKVNGTGYYGAWSKVKTTTKVK